MIQTLEELIAQSEREAARYEAEGFPTIANETRLRTSGCSDEELARSGARLGHAHVATVPNWPHWQLEEYAYLGLVVRQYWTKFEGHAYMVRQDYGADPNPVGETYCRYEPEISVCMRKGWPRQDPVRNWTMHGVADYPLPSIELGQEARAEVAAYRRHLPELLAELEAKKK